MAVVSLLQMVAAIVRLQILFFGENRMIFSFSQAEDSRSGVRRGSSALMDSLRNAAFLKEITRFQPRPLSGSDQKPSSEMVGSDGF
jgi:hypothetical protein